MSLTRPIEDTIRPEFLRGTDDQDYNADDVPYDNTSSGMTATDVQAAIDELSTGGVTEITTIPTSETDTTLVLAPDGAGGVEWRAETGGSSGFKGFLIRKSGTQNVADSTYAYIAWATEVRDDDGWVSLGVSNNRGTAPYDCAVEIFAMGFWGTDADNEREMYIEAGGNVEDYSVIPGFTVTNHTQVAHVPYVELTTGDIVQLAVQQFSGNTLSFGGGNVPAYLFVKVLEML